MNNSGELPGDRTTAALAYSAAAVGAVGVATLAAMYAVEVPKGGPFVFGTINDATGAVFNLLAIPVILQIHKRIPATPWSEPLKWVTVAACAAGATSSTLLVLKVLEFGPSTAISVTAIVIQGLWFLVANNNLLHVTDYPTGARKAWPVHRRRPPDRASRGRRRLPHSRAGVAPLRHHGRGRRGRGSIMGHVALLVLQGRQIPRAQERG